MGINKYEYSCKVYTLLDMNMSSETMTR